MGKKLKFLHIKTSNIVTLVLYFCFFISITSFFGSLPRYYKRMASIVSQIVVVFVNRELSDGPVNWPYVSRRNCQNSE